MTSQFEEIRIRPKNFYLSLWNGMIVTLYEYKISFHVIGQMWMRTVFKLTTEKWKRKNVAIYSDRSGSTLIGLRILKYERKKSTEYFSKDWPRRMSRVFAGKRVAKNFSFSLINSLRSYIFHIIPCFRINTGLQLGKHDLCLLYDYKYDLFDKYMTFYLWPVGRSDPWR